MDENLASALIKQEQHERAELTLSDYSAAGVDPPDWINEPIPSLETWRRWQAAQDKALAHKRARARVHKSAAAKD
ncbi:MAG: hypothetical protein JNM59_06435 [Hyphomonadaceae bacterium]|nr:hypothetical protein [Hyphomonadaceae bacterium]